MSAAFVKVVADLGLLDDYEDPGTKIESHPLISERSADEPRKLKVIYIGAGISGIVAAIQFQAVPALDLSIYEKNADVGGTWFENTYPGVACGKFETIPTYLDSKLHRPRGACVSTLLRV